MEEIENEIWQLEAKNEQKRKEIQEKYGYQMPEDVGKNEKEIEEGSKTKKDTEKKSGAVKVKKEDKKVEKVKEKKSKTKSKVKKK